MSNYIFKHFANFIMACVVVVSFFIFIFQLVSVNASRDAQSNSIRRIEKECTQLKNEIRVLESEKNRLCNDETLKKNKFLAPGFKEAPNGNIIRIRTTSVPHATGRPASATQPRALALELYELAATQTRSRN